MTGTAAQEAQPFPWHALMALLMGERAMAPGDFWALSLPEIRAVLGDAPTRDAATRRADLLRLMEAYPDGK
ncbi:MAG: hypothetical protein AcusKO_26430 [Acuticoccus sp.]